MTAALDDFLVRHAPGPRVPISPAVTTARDALDRATAALRTVPDSALEAPWPWRGADADVRYGFYRILELLEAAATDVSAVLREVAAGGGTAARTPSGDLAALATAARWDLHGRLAVLDEELLDRDPGGGEWTVRRTLGHIVNGQRAYGWFTAWWLAQGLTDAAALPPRAPDDLAGLPDEETEGEGSLADIRARLDATLDASSEVLGALGPGELARFGRWSGYPVTIAFRIGRWSSHLREHTVQVDKTLEAVGWRAREVDRLVGLVHGAYGRLETLVFAAPAALLAAADGKGRTAAGLLGESLEAAETRAGEVAAAASSARSSPASG